MSSKITHPSRSKVTLETVITYGNQQGNIGFGCNKCGAVFRFRIGLSQHIKSVHEGVKYDCNQCDYRATQQSHLTQHIHSVHE